jgi:RNA polymerase sigma-70 factor (ECF subfamily)
MSPDELAERLTSIRTHWTKLFQAHRGAGSGAAAAQQELLLRYYGAAYRYLLGILRTPAGAEELTQEFAVRFLRGDFQRADPQRGRFRDFLKTALRHLATDYWRKQGKGFAPLPSDSGAVTEPPAGGDLDRPFLESWREELMALTWEALAEVEVNTGQPYHTLLRWKTEQPALRSGVLGERLRARSGKPLTEEGVRKLLQRARERFADLLVDEVARSLETADPEQIEQELIELGLLTYCRSALKRRHRPG